MPTKHRLMFVAVFLILVPPVAALVSASLAVSVSRHQEVSAEPTPAIWDAFFPIFFLASFFTVPIGIYLIYRSFRLGQ